MENNDPRSDERQEVISNDGVSIEVLSEGGDSHTGDLEWSIYSASKSTAGSDVSLMDFQKPNIHSKMATIVHYDGRQFIERRDSDDGLPYSAEFHLGDEVWKLSGEDFLLMSPRQYIAEVSVAGMVDLDGAVDFDEAVRKLLSKLKVVNIFMDKQLGEHNKAQAVVEMLLGKLTDGLKENIDHKQDLMLLRMLFKKHGSSLNQNFKIDLKNCSRLSREIMSALDNYVAKALKLIQRNDILFHLNNSPLSDEFINDAIQGALKVHRSQLATACPSTMKDKLNELDNDHVLCVTTDDMGLFADLTSLNQAMFEPALKIIFSKFMSRVQQINGDDQLDVLGSLSNRIFLYICKSMQEIAEQLGAHIKADNVIVYSEEHGWVLTDQQGESQTSYSKCLRQQLQMLTKLANHFEPGGPFRTCRFPYEFKLFQDMDAIPEQVCIWLCLLDDSIKDEIKADFDKMQLLSCLFKSCVSFVTSKDMRSESLECLRMITHDALRSLTEIKSSQHEQNGLDSALLECNDMTGSNLKEQPDFTCFEGSQQEKGGPQVVEESSSLKDVCSRVIPLVNDNDARASPYPNAIDNEETLVLLKYTIQYEKYITETGTLTRDDRINRIVSDVQLRVEPQLATYWTEEFKRNTLPDVLAGLCAVWSIIVSKIDCSLEKLMKPTSLQINCILRLFDGQNDKKEYFYRLQYLSTLQGKDLVLGLTAALLALYGHKVQIICYNRSLSSKNSTDLLELFKSFSVHRNISYGSVDDMARERSRVVYDKYVAYVYECLGIAIDSKKQPQIASEEDKLALLIADIDIIFSEKILGMAFERFVAPNIPGLRMIQEKIFEADQNLYMRGIDRFIKSTAHPQICNLKEFLGRPQPYTILQGHLLEEKDFTNSNLFTTHIDTIKRWFAHNGNLRLTRDGFIIANTLDKIDVFNSRNSWDYFKMKNSGFQPTVAGYKNYGYLPICFLPFPYASLLKSFPLILGFGSAPLNGFEELILPDHYGTYHQISKSIPFNFPAVKFDSHKDFLCIQSKLALDWMIAIMVAIKAAIKRNDSVLVFFRSVIEMHQFQSEFDLQLRQLSVTAIETASNGKNLCEEEIAVEEVTVLVVEAKERSVRGPQDRKVHVIQTFFSNDRKEEDLIRRQAEQRYSSGSYELIIHRAHVSIPDKHSQDNINYDLLVKLRTTRTFGEAKECLNNNMDEYEKILKFCRKL